MQQQPASGHRATAILTQLILALTLSAYQAVNPTAQYIVAGLATYPRQAAATLTTPPINNWDLTLAKHIALTERYRIEFLLQALNAFNHPEFVTGSPNQALQISDVGSQRNYFIPNQPNFFNAQAELPEQRSNSAVGVEIQLLDQPRKGRHASASLFLSLNSEGGGNNLGVREGAR